MYCKIKITAGTRIYKGLISNGMKKVITAIILGLVLTVLNTNHALAVYDPLSVPNNKIGIHVLFTHELSKAAELVNSTSGDWGYVTIPIQAGDKDIKKWQKFMDDSASLHLVPIIRLATEGDYFVKASWRRPKDSDILDFANFLNSLDWPVKNRYIIIFNEVNRGDEWKGKADPGEYAQILSYAVTLFKSKSQDYFIISAGLDNAAATDGKNYTQYDYFRLMNQAVPGIFNQIDGFASHSYPNPAFSSPPSVITPNSIASFTYELQTVESLSIKKLPVFITETGWSQEVYSEKVISNYFKEALGNVWADSNIVAITPFLLNGEAGPFSKFSFLKENGEKNEIFKTFESLPKTKGEPLLYPKAETLGISQNISELPIKKFPSKKKESRKKDLKLLIKWIFLGI